MDSKKRRLLITVVILLAVVIILTLFQNRPMMGSAKTLDGTTIVVSIFADDINTKWDEKDDADKIKNIYKYLDIAGTYLEDVAAQYNKSASFITVADNLKYNMTFDMSITEQDKVDNGELDNPVWEFIDKNIDEKALKKKYNAKNVVYMLFVDSDETNTAVSCTRSYYEGMPYNSEIVYLYNVDSDVVNCPAVYAHEILHTFGALDLYMEDEEHNITSDFMTYVKENMPNDIMLTSSDLDSDEYLYDKITNEVGEVTAFYVGLTNRSSVVKDWNLK